ncbi:MAG TPA: hypothetical protein VJP60_06850 [Rhizomicrobium sp.]|nr:hypothetical protein [Rhizomicrobium sp.]
MKSLALRFLTAFVNYLAGERLIAALFPQGMDYRRAFWDVIRDTFNYEYYSFGRIAMMAGISGLILLTDRIGSKRIPVAWLALIAAFSGGYYYAVVFSLDNLADSVGAYLNSVLPEIIADIVGLVMYFLALFFPFVLLAAIKLAGSQKFRGRFAFGGSKA